MRFLVAILALVGTAAPQLLVAEEVPPPPPLAGQDAAIDAPSPPEPAAPPLPPRLAAPGTARGDQPKRCPPPPSQSDPPETAQRKAFLLEQRGDFDAAGKLWSRQLADATGETRIALERRVNALAQLEVTLAELTTAKAKADLRSLEKARFDLLAMAKPPLRWPFPAAAAVVLARAGLGVDTAQEVAGSPWWQERARAGSAAGLKVLVERRMGGPEDEKPSAVAWLADGSAVTLAAVDLGPAGLKLRAWGTDATGRPRWNLTWAAGGQGGRDDVIATAAPLADGTWMAGGYVQHHGMESAWILRGDARGKVLTDKLLSVPGRVVSLLPQADGSVWAGVEQGPSARVVAVSIVGQELWSVALKGTSAKLLAGPKGMAFVADLPPQRVRGGAGQGAVDVVIGKDLKLFSKLTAKPAGLLLRTDAAGATVVSKRGSLRVAGSAPWQLVPLGAKQWLIMGAVSEGSCHRDITWIRLLETK
jgi:hypothetical protein